MKINDICYLDSTFLISYFTSNHQDHIKAKKFMFELFKNKKRMLISCLVLDETFYKVRETLQYQIPKNKRKPFRDYHLDFKKILEFISKNPLFELIQFKNDLYKCLEIVIENIKDYNLRPRDAFHYAMMKNHKVDCIITQDRKDFEPISDLKVISY